MLGIFEVAENIDQGLEMTLICSLMGSLLALPGSESFLSLWYGIALLFILGLDIQSVFYLGFSSGFC